MANTESTRDKEKYSNTIKAIESEFPAIWAEILFVVLPFLIVLIVNVVKGEPNKLLQTSDWALAAAILYGQTIVKLGMGLGAQEHSFNYQRMGLIIAALIVLGLVPSIVIVVIFLLTSEMPIWLIGFQYALFGCSIFYYLRYGAIGQMLSNTAFKNKIAKILNLNNDKENA